MLSTTVMVRGCAQTPPVNVQFNAHSKCDNVTGILKIHAQSSLLDANGKFVLKFRTKIKRLLHDLLFGTEFTQGLR